jgi:hypothetical protein|tara:strand:+ start:282 stop:410 length:129 start_codon:yes stop_codon:yes gene_type:complete
MEKNALMARVERAVGPKVIDCVVFHGVTVLNSAEKNKPQQKY